MIQRAARRKKAFDIQPPFEALKGYMQSPEIESAPSVVSLASLLNLPAIQKIFGSFKSVRSDMNDEFAEI